LSSVPPGVDDLITRLRVATPDGPQRPCHNDTWPPNFIDDGSVLHLLDWEYSGMNDPAWDLADLSVEAGLDEAAEAHLLATYGTGHDPGLPARVAALKPVTDLLWGLWALVQHAVGHPADDFEAYGSARLARALAVVGSTR
jgi:thiamine kinase-like enzyme